MLVNPTRGYHWSDAETRALLTIWGEHDVQTALDGNFRNSHVYRDVAGRLGDMGYDRTPDQCRVRVKSLKRQYFQAKKASKKNGHYAKIFRFYKDMERILSSRSVAGFDAHDMDGMGAEGDETMDGTEEDGESVDQPHESDMDGAGECSNMEYPVKIEYPPYPIPVTVGSCSSKYPVTYQLTIHRTCITAYPFTLSRYLVYIFVTDVPDIPAKQTEEQPTANPSSAGSRRHKKRFANLSLEKLMEKFLEQSLEAEENFYRLEEQRLQAEDLRRETEHTREMHMLQMLGQMFAGLTTPTVTSSSPAPQSTCNSKTGPSVTRARPFGGSRSHQTCPVDYASPSPPHAPGLRRTVAIHY